MNDAERRRRELLEQTRFLYSDKRIMPAVHPRYGNTYHYLYGKSAWLLALRFLYAHKGTLCTDVSIRQAKQWMKEGIREAKERSQQ